MEGKKKIKIKLKKSKIIVIVIIIIIRNFRKIKNCHKINYSKFLPGTLLSMDIFVVTTNRK